MHASGAAASALRVAWQGHTIAYTGDTEWTEVLVEVARGADLLSRVGEVDFETARDGMTVELEG